MTAVAVLSGGPACAMYRPEDAPGSRRAMRRRMNMKIAGSLALLAALALAATACESGPIGLAPTPAGTGARVKFDTYHKPLPEIPLPNDFATRFDASSVTLRRVNASMVAPTVWEQKTRANLDAVDGWGTNAPISVSFDAPLDVTNILARQDDRFDPKNDVMLVIDITAGSPDRCKPMPMDIGQNLFPTTLDENYNYPNDPRASLKQLVFEEVEEDLNGNGVLDPGEDTDMDGVLDHPNARNAKDGSLITFYESETHTLIAKPVMPLREGTTYAVVLTKNLLDANGQPVRSPFDFINHTAQTEALGPLPECLGTLGFATSDVAFAWTFTTQNWTKPFIAARDGLYGIGPFAYLATDFPPDMKLADVRDPPAGGGSTKIVPNEQFLTLAKQLYTQFGPKTTPEELKLFFDNFGFVDFHALGSIDSPQFFPRFAADGKTLLSNNDQTWQFNPDTGEAFIRREGVTFWLFVPKFRKGPAPVAIFVHGHGSNKFDTMNFAPFLARHGIASLGIDAVSHGVGQDPALLDTVLALFDAFGIKGMGQAIIAGRALDQNADGKLDSGADFWTSYIFHTRDEVRQTTVDIMQVVRTLSSFDGKRTWAYDANGDGKNDLAGDFDGDGTVDVGGSAPIHMVGGSLGGILSSFVAGMEPKIETAVAIIAGGVLGEVGTRSSLGGVRVAMILRMMGPLLLVHDGALWEAFPDLVNYKEVKIATVPALTPGKIAVLENLDSGEHRCARVQAGGLLRVAVSSDKGNRLRLSLYDTELPSLAPDGCDLAGAPSPTLVIAKLAEEVQYGGDTFIAGSPLVAFTDGYGLRRGNPELRRMLGLAQIALDGADPENSAPFIHQDRVLTYGTGETVGSRILYLNTLGDPGVPTATGVALGRAAGLVNFRDVDPRYNKSVQQLLVDVGLVEGVDGTKRYVDKNGVGVLYDVDNFGGLVAQGDGFDEPRLNPPLRNIRHNDAKVGGISAQMFPDMTPQGVHGFPSPGLPTAEKPFNLGSLLVNQFAHYMVTHGEVLDFDLCQMDWTCSWIPAPLPAP
jgi:hypothetical protein